MGHSPLLLFSFLLLTLIQLCKAQNCGVSRRRPWRSLSCDEQEEFLSALRQLKDSGAYDDIARVHWQTGGAAHQRPEFLPWHRYYIWVFERELQRVSNRCISLPYWDWERGSLDTILQQGTFGSQSAGCVRDGVAAGWQGQNGCLSREFNNRFSFTRDVEVLSRITNSRSFSSFSRDLEGAPHTSVHQYIGGSMSNMFSTNDPLFWLHHANVDRIWALWQNYHGHPQLNANEYGQDHYSADLDDRLVVSGDQGGFFDRPTIRDLMNPRGGVVNVQYVEDNLARNLAQTSNRFATEIDENWNSPGQSNSNPQCTFGNNNNNGENNREPQLSQEQPPCRERNVQCNRDEQCCSESCVQGRCRDANNGDEEDADDQRQPEDEPTCRPGGEVCFRNRHCCSGWCDDGECWEEEQEQQQQQQQEDNNQQQCRRGGQTCTRNRHCCSGWCDNGECWEEEQEQEQDNNQQQCRQGGQTCSRNRHCCSGWCSNSGRCWEEERREEDNQQQCRRGGQSCTRNGHCCSGWCDDGECWEEQEQEQQNQECLDDWEGCFRSRDCCSGVCRGRVCWEAENDEPTCSEISESCNRDSDCCSSRCRWGTCRRSRNNLRRATVSSNHTVDSEEEPGFSSPALDQRWHDLVGLYGTSNPGLIFSLLGQEDCDNRTKAANHTVESADLDYIKRVSNLSIEAVHTFDCHYVMDEDDGNSN